MGRGGICFILYVVLIDVAISKTLFFENFRPENMDDEGHFVFDMKDKAASDILEKIDGGDKIPSFIPGEDETERQAFDMINEAFGTNSDEEKDFGEKSRQKRSAGTTAVPPTGPSVTNSSDDVTRYVMKDSLRQMIIHWAGEGSPYIVVLTKDVSVEEVASKSNVYFSPDYGKSFEKKTDVTGVISKFYHTPSDINSYIFVDVTEKNLYITRDMGKTFSVRRCPFKPTYLSVHPVRTTHIFGYDKKASNKTLWLSKDYGNTWQQIQLNVRAAYWGHNAAAGFDNPDTLYVERLEPSGRVSILKSETFFQYDTKENVLITNVQDFAIRNDSLFATRPGKNGDHDLLLTVSRHSPFVVANIQTKLAKKEFFIIDAADRQIMILVSHGFGHTDLYISEQNKVDFIFSLANVTYFNPKGIGSTQMSLINRNDRFADIHKIQGLRTIFIANTARAGKYQQYNMSSMKTQISFDKGVIWEDVPPPRRDSNGMPMCNSSACSLHIMQEFHHAHIATMSSLVLSAASAPGYVLAAGNVGTNIKNKIDLFFSPNGGKDWKEIRKGEWFYTWADHGGIIAIAQKYGRSKEMFYTMDEGETWHNISFYTEPINIYGLMTEPGETTTTFTVFGGTNDAISSWVIIQVNLSSQFSYKCSSYQYRTWSPEDENGMSCLLGAKYTYKRKSVYYSESCYNGMDYDRPVSIESCHCTRFDFECDKGFYLVPNSRSLACRRDPNSNIDPYEVPPNCRSGTTYKRTKGYQRIPGDICEGGDADETYGPTDAPCPVIKEDAFLLVTSSSGVSRINLDNEKLDTLPVDVSYATGIENIDYDYSSNCLYFTLNNQIKRQCLDGSTTANKTIIQERMRISSMAFDWDSRNIYWAVQSSPPTIKVMSIDSDLRYTRKLPINSSLLHQATSMAIHARKGYLYYSDLTSYSSGTKIIRVKLDGSNATVISGRSYYSIHWYSSLQVDESSNRLFFISKSSYFARVASMDLDDHHYQHTVRYDSQAKFVVTYKEYVFFWREAGDIQRADKYRYGSNHTVAFNLKNAGTLKVVRRGLQAYSNRCGKGTSNCPQLCIPLPNDDEDKDAVDTCYCDNINYVGSGKDCQCRTGEVSNSLGQCEPNKTACNVGDFKCGNGKKCIPITWKCDHGNDCDDGSDELGCAYEKCKEHYKSCGSSQYCIQESWFCDGERDCVDGSDEADCGKPTCNATTQFTCRSGQCIRKSYNCDASYDCDDESDEENCFSTPSTCSDDQFLCHAPAIYGSSCIPLTWKCDGESDCSDGSDEAGCSNTTTKCYSFQFSCGDGTCIYDFRHCDGDKDCANGADEKGCPQTSTASSTTSTPPFHSGNCRSNELMCLNHGTCIPLQWKCDGTNDCGDHSDEFDCSAASNNSIVGPHHCFSTTLQYTCNNGLCVLAFFECDGDNDCGDWSDEKHCSGFANHGNHPGCFSGNGVDYTGTRNYTKSGKTCQMWSSNTPHDPHYRPQNPNHNYCRNPDNDGYGPWCYTTDPNTRWEYCGIPHCANNGSAQIYPIPTSAPNDCHDGYYSCGGGRCIPDRWVCDGDADCSSGIDENWCNFSCNAATEFMCRNRRCVMKSAVCDGNNDCVDNSDEEQSCVVTTTSPPCNTLTHFRCEDGNKCIPKNQVCDGFYDCRDRMDEWNCSKSDGGTPIPPQAEKHPCPENSSVIVTGKALCDYIADCPRASDEENCVNHTVKVISTTSCSPHAKGACETIMWSAPRQKVPKERSDARYMLYHSTRAVPTNALDEIKKMKVATATMQEHSAHLHGLDWSTTYYVYITISANKTVLPVQRASRSSFKTAMGPPGKPTRVSAAQSQRTGADLYVVPVSWKVPTKNAKGISGYFIKATDKSGHSRVRQVVFIDDACDKRCSYVIKDIHSGVINISVLATNGIFNSSWSKPFRVYVGDMEKPTLTLDKPKDYSCNVSWTDSSSPSDFGAYNIRVSATNLPVRYFNVTDRNKKMETVTKLQPQTAYLISVAVVNSAGEPGPYSDERSVTITAHTLFMPEITKTSPNSTTAVNVEWVTSPSNPDKSFVYEVSWNVESERDATKSVKVKGNSATIPNLPVNTPQIFQIRVIDPYIGYYSAEVEGTPAYDFSEAPRNIIVKLNPDYVSGYVNWSRPTDSSQQPLAYVVQLFKQNSGEQVFSHIIASTKNETLHHNFNGVTPGETYLFSIRVNKTGSKPRNQTFHDGVVPGPAVIQVDPMGRGTNDYKILFHIEDKYKEFYHSSSVAGISSWACGGLGFNCTDDATQKCKALADVNATQEAIEADGLDSGKNYTLCLRAKCKLTQECDFSSFQMMAGYGGIFQPVTSSPAGFTLTPLHIAAIAAPVSVLILVLLGVIVYLQIRKKRLADAYRGFVASHYDPQSGEAIFVSNNDDDDDNGVALDDENDAETPLITGFADDEPLIVA